uniref:Ovule protein n=1 Tax=Acrobeloides nanus TaxID=290746 RepID=A0A914D6D8_9BILA
MANHWVPVNILYMSLSIYKTNILYIIFPKSRYSTDFWKKEERRKRREKKKKSEWLLLSNGFVLESCHSKRVFRNLLNVVCPILVHPMN